MHHSLYALSKPCNLFCNTTTVFSSTKLSPVPQYRRTRISHKYHHNPRVLVLALKSTQKPPSLYEAEIIATKLTDSSNPREGAKEALYYYLYETRALSYFLSRLVSHNCPTFLKKLLTASKNVRRRDACKDVERYLRFNTINEFEPFFESIGVTPSKIPDVLPPDEIFIDRKPSLVENVETLMRFGVPVTKIGLIYQDAKEVFSLVNGELNGKLNAYKTLGLTNKSLSVIYPLSPELLLAKNGIDEDFETLVKKMRELGFRKEEISVTLAEVFEKIPKRWRTVTEKLKLLSGLGCNKDSKVLRENFKSICLCSVVSLKNRIDFFSNLGIVNRKIGDMILRNPFLLEDCAEARILVNVKFLRASGLKNGVIIDVLMQHPQVLGPNVLDVPDEVLAEAGICDKKITTLKNRRARFLVLSEFGMDENSTHIWKLVKTGYGTSEDLRRKLKCFEDAGVSRRCICRTIKAYPKILEMGSDLIDKKIDFMVKTVGLTTKGLERCLHCVRYNLDRRLKPRWKMLQWLKERKLIKQNYSYRSALIVSEEGFYENFVNIHEDGPEVFAKIKLECCQEE